LAARDVANGQITLGDIVLINAMMLQLFIPLSFLGVVYRSLQYSLADMDLVIKLLEKDPEISDIANAQELAVANGRVEFRDVKFSYLPERPILHGISFIIEPGSKVAVVGPSGSGKSTLSRLLFRFYDPNSGEILIDNQNIRDVTQASLRKQLGVVPQDTVMFNNSIEYNLGYARADATSADIDDAIASANLRAFIDDLPEGLETVVGERGLKQRHPAWILKLNNQSWKVCNVQLIAQQLWSLHIDCQRLLMQTIYWYWIRAASWKAVHMVNCWQPKAATQCCGIYNRLRSSRKLSVTETILIND